MDLKMDIPEISLVELQQRVSPHTDLKMISPVTPPVVDEPEPATAGIWRMELKRRGLRHLKQIY